MGSVEPYETRDGRRYRVRYRDPDRRSREKAGYKTKRDAELALAALEVSIARGDFIDDTAGRATVAELGKTWLASQTHLKPSSFKPIEIAWRVYVAPRWGKSRIGTIRHSDVQTWITQLGAGTAASANGSGRPLSATSVIRAHGVLASILDVAVKDRRLASNPARGVNLPRKRPKRREYLTHQQVELLASQAGAHGVLVAFLAYTGLRWGEATALRIRNVDMLRRRVLVEENAVNVGGAVVVGTPKTHETRSVPFPRFLAIPISQLCADKTREQLLFGNGDTHLRPPDRRRGWWVSAIRKARLEDPEFPEVTLHDLRHTAASLAISSGANVKAVQRMLGHANASMTLDTYADLFEDDLDAVSERLDAARAQSVVGDLWGLGPR